LPASASRFRHYPVITLATHSYCHYAIDTTADRCWLAFAVSPLANIDCRHNNDTASWYAVMKRHTALLPRWLAIDASLLILAIQITDTQYAITIRQIDGLR